MKYYDFKKIRREINKANKDTTRPLVSAEIGMSRDWFWTALTAFEGGKWKHDLKSEVAGLFGSCWDTPKLVLNYADGSERHFDVTTDKNPEA